MKRTLQVASTEFLPETSVAMETLCEGVPPEFLSRKEDDDEDASLRNGVMEADVEAALSRAHNFTPRKRKPLYEAPEFVKRLNAFEEAKAGTTVVFECKYKSFPKSNVRWFKDDEEIADDHPRYTKEVEEGGLIRLVIEDCCKEDEAAYKCKAENSEGGASSTGYLSVTGKPEEKPLNAQPRKVPSDHMISAAPPLRTIIEQKSVEEREAEAMALQPPSPLQDFIQDRRSRTWPLSHMNPLSNGDNPDGNKDDDDSGSDTSIESQCDAKRMSLDFSSDDVFDDHSNDSDSQDKDKPIKVESMIIVNRKKLEELGLSDVYEPGLGRLNDPPDWGEASAPKLQRTAALDHDEESHKTVDSSNDTKTENSLESQQHPENVIDGNAEITESNAITATTESATELLTAQIETAQNSSKVLQSISAEVNGDSSDLQTKDTTGNGQPDTPQDTEVDTSTVHSHVEVSPRQEVENCVEVQESQDTPSESTESEIAIEQGANSHDEVSESASSPTLNTDESEIMPNDQTVQTDKMPESEPTESISSTELDTKPRNQELSSQSPLLEVASETELDTELELHNHPCEPTTPPSPQTQNIETTEPELESVPEIPAFNSNNVSLATLRITDIQFPTNLLFYLPLLAAVTFWASCFEIDPLYVIILVSFISIISFEAFKLR